MAASPFIFAVLICACSTLVLSVELPCEREIDLGIIMDGSASMGESNFFHIKTFVKEISKRFVIGPENTQIGVIPFSHYFKIQIPLNQYTDYNELTQAVDNIAYEGSGSTLGGALRIAQLELFTPLNGGRKQPVSVDTVPGTVDPQESEGKGLLEAVVVISDGGSSTGVDSLLNSSEKLRRSGKRVFVVGVGENDYMRNIKMMASDPESSHIFLAKKGKDLKGLVDKVAKAICTDIRPTMRKFTVTENDKVITSVMYNSNVKGN